MKFYSDLIIYALIIAESRFMVKAEPIRPKRGAMCRPRRHFHEIIPPAHSYQTFHIETSTALLYTIDRFILYLRAIYASNIRDSYD